MTRDQQAFSDAASPFCRRCHQPIDLQSADDCLDKFGNFFRLRCSVPECGHVDWYKDVKPPQPVTFTPEIIEGPGEVWIHDVILGLSFRADAQANHDLGFDGRDRQL